jgi:hypothetical protein
MKPMDSIFIDTNIPMFAAGGKHPQREPAQRVILGIVQGEINAVTNAEVFQEILYRYLHIGQRKKGLEIFDRFHRIMLGHILPVEEGDVWQARELVEKYPSLEARDLIHLGVMLRHNIQEIITVDIGFNIVEEVHRIDPSTF